MKLTVLLTFCITTTICYSQRITLDNVLSKCRKINDLIEKCSTAEDCELYQDTISINSKHGAWRAVGNYNRYTTFWYNDDPRSCDENGIAVLKKIEVVVWSGVYKTRYEFIFDKGYLIYYQLTDLEQHQYYFNETRLLRFMKNEEVYPVENVQLLTARIRNVAI